MGSASSSINDIESNEALLRLTGDTPIDSIDPFWNSLLSFSLTTPINNLNAKQFENATLPLFKRLVDNNLNTGNFGSLIRNFLVRCVELETLQQKEDNFFMWQTYNALFIIRSSFKHLVENVSEETFLNHFNKQSASDAEIKNKLPDDEKRTSSLEEFLCSIIELLVDLPVIDTTYRLHVEAVNTVILLLSIQLYQPQPASNFFIFKMMMQGQCSIHACLLTKALITNFVNQVKCPVGLYKSEPGSNVISRVSSSMASGLWNVLTLGMAHSKQSEESTEILANQSLSLLLILVNHCTSVKGLSNPYRESLYSFADSQDNTWNGSPTQDLITFKINFRNLYETLCETLKHDETSLLLYLLIHQNSSVKAYILSRSNLELLVLPILRILYDAPDRNSHHIYMALIILLILSEDDYFNRVVHEIIITDPKWFKERAISDISLGGLLILVMIRTIQFNMTRMRDKYLHTNCLAALANMSSNFNHLHPYVAQRIVSLFALLSKKQQKLVKVISNSPQESDEETPGMEEYDNNVEDLAVLEEVMRMVLEIINSTLSHSLQHNTNLIYCLLHQREVFVTFRLHPAFQDLIQNVETVLCYFTSRLEERGQQVSFQEVYHIVADATHSFSKDRLKKFPDLKFKYVEEESPEEFFIPYVWSLVCNSDYLHFNPHKIILFSIASV